MLYTSNQEINLIFSFRFVRVRNLEYNNVRKGEEKKLGERYVIFKHVGQLLG